MWDLQNRTSYMVARNWVRDETGRHFWVVSTKATFDVTSGLPRLADQQRPPALAPHYHGEPGSSSLRCDSDLLLVKSGTDIIADACAHAPGGRACRSMEVALRCGLVQKRLQVQGKRLFFLHLGSVATSDPVPFEQMPITYEGAYGGTDIGDPDPNAHRIYARNPVGKGFAASPQRLVNQLAPSIEYGSGQKDAGFPAGFGAIDASWSPRRELAGTFDDAWAKAKKPLLPDDYNPLFASCAPADQRTSTPLRGGEAVELLGVTPAGAWRFNLPKIYLAYATYFGRRREEHRGHLVTVLLCPERQQVELVWQTALFVGPRDLDYLDYTIITEKRYIT